MNLRGILLDLYYGPSYDEGYYYPTGPNGVWEWWPHRLYEWEIHNEPNGYVANSILNWNKK